MRPSRIIVVDVARQHMTQVPLPEYDDMVKALPADRANQTLRIVEMSGIGPKPTWLPAKVDAPTRPELITLKNRTLSPLGAQRFVECAREIAKPLANRKV